MKYYYIFFFALFLLISCGKENIKGGGSVTANYNGMPWSGVSYVKNLGDNRVGTNFVVYEKRVEIESFGFQFIPNEIGEYNLEFMVTDSLFRSIYNTSSHDGDVIKDLYRLDESKTSNVISITSLAETEIEGEFDLTFKIDTSRIKIDVNAPDIIHFTNGKFQSQISE